MATSVVLTKELVLKIGTDTIARCTDYSLSINKETIDITSLDDDGWKKKLADLKEYSISFSSMVTRGTLGASETDFNEILTSFIGSDSALAWTLIDGETGAVISLSGNAILNNLEVSGTVGDKVTWSGSMEGDGAISQS